MASQKFNTSAKWRQQPVTADQSKVLQNRRIEVWGGITRGEASNLLLKHKLGALRESRKIQKQKMITKSF